VGTGFAIRIRANIGDDLMLRGSRGPVRHSTDRYDFRTQLLDRRAVAHRGLPD
jgi:hypothetical protein